MSDLSNFIETLEAKVASYQKAIMQSLANHNNLLGAFKAATDALNTAKSMASQAAPIVDAALEVLESSRSASCCRCLE